MPERFPFWVQRHVRSSISGNLTGTKHCGWSMHQNPKEKLLTYTELGMLCSGN